MQDTPAGIAALSAMRELLVILRQKGLLSAVEVLDMVDKFDPGITADQPFEKQLYSACLWLKEPHLGEGVVQLLQRSAQVKQKEE